jgi:hypothetical protein
MSLLDEVKSALEAVPTLPSNELDSALITLSSELVANLQATTDPLLQALFPTGRTRRPDLRQNAFGLTCGLIDETLRPCYEDLDDAIVQQLGRENHELFLIRWTTPRREAGGVRLYPTDLRHVYTGWNHRRAGETLYSYEEMVSGGRDVGFAFHAHRCQGHLPGLPDQPTGHG